MYVRVSCGALALVVDAYGGDFDARLDVSVTPCQIRACPAILTRGYAAGRQQTLTAQSLPEKNKKPCRQINKNANRQFQ